MTQLYFPPEMEMSGVSSGNWASLGRTAIASSPNASFIPLRRACLGFEVSVVIVLEFDEQCGWYECETMAPVVLRSGLI